MCIMSASAVTDYGHQICTADASDVDAPNDRFAPYFDYFPNLQ